MRENSYTSHIFTGIYALLLAQPVTVVQAVSLIFGASWMNTIALVVVIIGTNVINIILAHIYDSRVWKRIFGEYFNVFDSCYFEPIEIKELKGLEKMWDLRRENILLIPFLSRAWMRRIRAFYVHPNGLILPRTVTTYQMWGGASYVFVPQRPEEMDDLARFHLLHEIGHAATTNALDRMFGLQASVHCCLLFVFVAFHREAGVFELLTAVAIIELWAHYLDLQYLQQKRSNMDERLELLADAFALVHMARRFRDMGMGDPAMPAFRTAVIRIARRFRKRSKESPFWRYRERLLVRRAWGLSRRETKITGLGWGEGLNWFEQLVSPVAFWLVALIISGMFWLGATLRINEWEEIFALSLVWVVVPVLDHCYRMLRKVNLPSTQRARRKALEFLKAHAPPDLPPERRVESVLKDIF